MLDAFAVCSIAALFALAMLYAQGCDRLKEDR